MATVCLAAALEALDQACVAYRIDFAALPPGDGRGSAGLARSLSFRRCNGHPLFEFHPGFLTPDGHVRNPALPERGAPDGIVHYRGEPFDLWCADRGGGVLRPPQGVEHDARGHE